MMKKSRIAALYRCTGKISDPLYKHIYVGEKFFVLLYPHDDFVTVRNYHTGYCFDMSKQMLYDYFQKIKYDYHVSSD